MRLTSVLVVLLAICGVARADSPLAPFDRLIGGQWHTEGSYQTFTWGVGGQSVKAASFFIINGETELVSEGSWYWHPGENSIRGQFVAKSMPVVLFDYTTRFTDNAMISDLKAYDASGKELSYVESWVFTDDSHYEWTLSRQTAEGLVKEMSATYERRNSSLR